MLWFLIAGFSALVLAHAAPFPFLLEGFAPSRLDLAHAGETGAPTVYLTYDDGPNPRRRRSCSILSQRSEHAHLFPDRRCM